MSDIFDYLAWRGDLTFQQNSLNCVDSLIFSQMAYFPFDGLWGPEEEGKVTLKDAYVRLCEKQRNGEKIIFHMSKDEKLFRSMAESARFGRLILSDYVNSFDPEAEKQFAAITVFLPDGTFLAYRGTDYSLTGWNEDFNMSFTTPVPAQIEAAKYFVRIASRVPGKIYLGGHSKGGNLAAYAALFCSEELRTRIAAVYNNDGPGFDGTVVSKERMDLIKEKLNTFIPQSSVIGLLLEHEEDYTVVHSRQIGLLQHDLYSWDVKGPDFVRLKSVTEGSRFVDRTLKTWLAGLTAEQRCQFIEAVFEVLNASEAETFREMAEDPIRSSGRMLKSIRDTDMQTRKMIAYTVSQLVRAVQKNLTDHISEQMKLPEFLRENIK